MLTDLDIRRALRRLSGIYSPPKDVDALLDGWQEVLRKYDYDPLELSAAVSEYMETDTSYFPKPGRIRGMIVKARAEQGGGRTSGNGSWNQTLDGPCPVCGATLRLLAPEEQVCTAWDEHEQQFTNRLPASRAPQFGVLHDRQVHTKAGVRAVGYWR